MPRPTWVSRRARCRGSRPARRPRGPVTYATAAHQAARPGLNADQIGRLVTLELRRQEYLRHAGHRLHLIIDEPALIGPVGPPEVMAAQLRHLITVAASPSVTVQVAALATALPVLGPAFTLLSFADPADPGVAWCHGPAGQLIISRRAADVRALYASFDALARAALSPAASASLITSLIRG
jgi:hypothetical protein